MAQMVTVGIVDAHLTGGKADYSFFASRMKTHNNFACETMSESFMGSMNWGHECSVTLNKTPDLVTNLFAVIDRPGIYAVRKGGTGSSGSSGWHRRDGGATAGPSDRYKRGPPPGRVFPAPVERKQRQDEPQPSRRQVQQSPHPQPQQSHHRHAQPSRRAQKPGAQEYASEDDEGTEEVPSELFWDEDEDDVLDEDPNAVPEVYAHW